MSSNGSKICTKCFHTTRADKVWKAVRSSYWTSNKDTPCLDLVFTCPKCKNTANIFSTAFDLSGEREPPLAFHLGELHGPGAARVMVTPNPDPEFGNGASVTVYKLQDYPWLFVEVWCKKARMTYSVCCEN